MTRHRGLTLLEVLAATVLMAIVAGACLPLLGRSLSTLTPAAISGVSIHQLSLRADQLLAEHQDELDVLDRRGVVRFSWPDSPETEPVTVGILRTAGDREDHVWLAFTCGNAAIVRWRDLPPAQEAGP